MRRVVVTGLGLLTSLGCGVKPVWERLIGGQSGIRAIDTFETSDLAAKIGGLIPPGETAEGLFNPDDWMDPKDARRVDRFILYGMSAAMQAIADSGWEPQTDEDRCRTGMCPSARESVASKKSRRGR